MARAHSSPVTTSECPRLGAEKTGSGRKPALFEMTKRVGSPPPFAGPTGRRNSARLPSPPTTTPGTGLHGGARSCWGSLSAPVLPLLSPARRRFSSPTQRVSTCLSSSSASARLRSESPCCCGDPRSARDGPVPATAAVCAALPRSSQPRRSRCARPLPRRVCTVFAAVARLCCGSALLWLC